jgi:hypothetical protein
MIRLARLACVILSTCTVGLSGTAWAQNGDRFNWDNRWLFSVGADFGVGGGSSRFAGTAFDVPLSGGLFGAYFDARTFVLPNVAIGGRVGGFLSTMDGIRFNGATAQDHEIALKSIATIEAEFVYRSSVPSTLFLWYQTPRAPTDYGELRRHFEFGVTGGVAVAERSLGLIDATGFSTIDSRTSFGLTGAIQIGLPVTPQFTFTAGVRGIHFFDDDYFKGIRMKSDVVIGTVGVKVNLNPPVVSYDRAGNPVM